jgi:long-subunit acyl-CoA synthetase (AMP-forming)
VAPEQLEQQKGVPRVFDRIYAGIDARVRSSLDTSAATAAESVYTSSLYGRQ